MLGNLDPTVQGKVLDQMKSARAGGDGHHELLDGQRHGEA
jgi:hypothetical protein